MFCGDAGVNRNLRRKSTDTPVDHCSTGLLPYPQIFRIHSEPRFGSLEHPIPRPATRVDGPSRLSFAGMLALVLASWLENPPNTNDAGHNMLGVAAPCLEGPKLVLE